MQHQGLLSQRGVAADQLVEFFFARSGLHQRIDRRLELLRRGAFEKDLLARKLVDNLVPRAAACSRPPTNGQCRTARRQNCPSCKASTCQVLHGIQVSTGNGLFKAPDDRAGRKQPLKGSFARVACRGRPLRRRGLQRAQRHVVVGSVEPDLDTRVVELSWLAHQLQGGYVTQHLDALYVEGPEVGIAARRRTNNEMRVPAPNRSARHRQWPQVAPSSSAGPVRRQQKVLRCVGPEKVILPASR